MLDRVTVDSHKESVWAGKTYLGAAVARERKGCYLPKGHLGQIGDYFNVLLARRAIHGGQGSGPKRVLCPRESIRPIVERLTHQLGPLTAHGALLYRANFISLN